MLTACEAEIQDPREMGVAVSVTVRVMWSCAQTLILSRCATFREVEGDLDGHT
jgi:hypothetical protein